MRAERIRQRRSSPSSPARTSTSRKSIRRAWKPERKYSSGSLNLSYFKIDCCDLVWAFQPSTVSQLIRLSSLCLLRRNRLPSRFRLLGTSLLAPELENHSSRIPEVVLVVAEALRGTAEACALELCHHIFHLNGFNRDVLAQVVVQPSARRRRECVLVLLKTVRTAPGIRGSE